MQGVRWSRQSDRLYRRSSRHQENTHAPKRKKQFSRMLIVTREPGATTALKQARALTKRYPGYDVAHNSVGRAWLGKKIRGARWLSFLGPELTKQLGGVKRLKKAFEEPITVTKVGQGNMIRAGIMPELGDKNQKKDTPLLREIAKVLESATAFGEIVLLRTDFASRNESALESWERRFLD